MNAKVLHRLGSYNLAHLRHRFVRETESYLNHHLGKTQRRLPRPNRRKL
jgi:hypothetical protein